GWIRVAIRPDEIRVARDGKGKFNTQSHDETNRLLRYFPQPRSRDRGCFAIALMQRRRRTRFARQEGASAGPHALANGSGHPEAHTSGREGWRHRAARRGGDESAG